MTRFVTVAMGIACAASAAGCASAVGGPRAGGAPPASPDQAASTVSTEIHAPIEEVFRYVVPSAEGTRVTWTYVFTARACPVEPALRAAVGAFFQPYMERGLASIRRSIEAPALRASALEVTP